MGGDKPHEKCGTSDLIDAVIRRYQFLNDLTADEMRWATCNPGRQRELVAAIDALAPKVQDREASLEVAGLQSGVSMKRMNREDFFAKLAACDEERLKKVLWNLYWRGSAAMRERIEAEVDPQQRDRRSRIAKEPPDPHVVLDEVREFVALARSGAYLGGDRRVSPSERTRWRFTFQRLVTDAQGALQAEDVGSASTAVEELVDLACATREHDYFRSEDPVEAARFVVSDPVALLSGTTHCSPRHLDVRRARMTPI